MSGFYSCPQISCFLISGTFVLWKTNPWLSLWLTWVRQSHIHECFSMAHLNTWSICLPPDGIENKCSAHSLSKIPQKNTVSLTSSWERKLKWWWLFDKKLDILEVACTYRRINATWWIVNSWEFAPFWTKKKKSRYLGKIIHHVWK